MERNDLYEVEAVGVEPTGKIGPQAWMTAPATRAVLDALTRDGAEVRFVGGCVRDAIANRPVGDVDIATTAPPEEVVRLLEDAGIKAVPTGIEHGTVTAVTGGRHFEITTLRVDVETYGRHARVNFTSDWLADARRRDFTINALSATADGDVYDPFGGIDDLAHGRVRFIGHARDRIEEDYLRILRFFRFHATHGRPPADVDALAACRALAPNIASLSGERVRDEMLKILAAPYPEDTILLMRGERVLEHALPEAGEVGRLRALTWLVTRGVRVDGVEVDPLRNLAALLTTGKDGVAAAEAVAGRWHLSNRDAVRLASLAEALDMAPDAPEAERDRRLYRWGPETFRDRALLAWAAEIAVEPHQHGDRIAAWTALLEAAAGWQPRTFPLSGADVLALGIPQGPRVGELLAAVEDWWIEGGFTADREACRARLESLSAAER